MQKRYGQSRINNCPFCGKTGVTANKQGVPVCQNHKNNLLTDMKCLCGKWLDILNGKWGPYFRCENCGNINFNKVLEMSPQGQKLEENKFKNNSKKSESQVTSDDPNYFSY